MPNWTENAVVFTGPAEAVATIRYAIDDSGTLDFTALYPLPDGLEKSVSPRSVDEPSNILSEIQAASAAPANATEEWLDTPDGFAVQQYRHEITPAYHDYLVSEFGYDSWYDWQCAHWGTKWPACEGKLLVDEPEALAITFQTAWSAPEALYEALTRDHKGLGIHAAAIYEEENDRCYWVTGKEEVLVRYFDVVTEWYKDEEDAEDQGYAVASFRHRASE